MENKVEYLIKIKNFRWKSCKLIINDNDFQIINEKSKNHKIKTYSLKNAVVLDQSEKSDSKLLISSPLYNLLIKIIKSEDKPIILSKLEKIIKKNSAKTVFSQEYLNHLKDFSKYEDPLEALLFKLKTYKVLIGEMNIQLTKMKSFITEKLNSTLAKDFLTIHYDVNIISLEMEKQFKKIEKGIKKYLKVITNNNDNVNNKLLNENESSSSSVSSDENNINTNENIGENNNKRKNSKKKYYLNTQLIDYYNPNYEFKERVKLSKNIKCSENMIKEMITTFTKQIPAPIYFNEPLSMCQKQCEKFFYLDMLTKASKQVNDKPLQMCYISAFIIGEIFTNIGRFLKPFNPILGETYEYFENYHKFRYYAEQVKHKPQITAFVGETTDFIYYGDTLSDSSFKLLKGIELSFKNKINIIMKNSGNHYVFNRPIVYVKGLMKPPMYNDYSGITIIEDVNDKNIKCEISFCEQSWSSNVIGNFEGKVYLNDCESDIKYLIGGNWQEEIYITDPEGNNKQVLLSLNKNSTYLKNSMEKYTLPFYSCNFNYLNDALENSLPKNDSRFRLDIKYLEKGESFIDKAQMYKNIYEEKQRKELKDEGHQILFFTEKYNEETENNYYEPNGEYWEWKKNGKLLNNKYKDIFEVEEYIKKEEEKEKQEKEKEEKINEKNEAKAKENEEKNAEKSDQNNNIIIEKDDKKIDKVGKDKPKESIKNKEEKEENSGKKNESP